MQSDWVFAPSLYVYEVTNALWKYHRLAGIELTELQLAWEQAIALANELISADALCAEALRISCEVACPAYDAAYLAAARARGAALLTLDLKLTANARRVQVPIARL
jgi:predicted nucleic acid-binding protein